MKKCIVILKKLILILIFLTLFKSFIFSLKLFEVPKDIPLNKHFFFIKNSYKIKRNIRSNLNIYFYKNIFLKKYLFLNEYCKILNKKKNVLLYNFESYVEDKKKINRIPFYKSKAKCTSIISLCIDKNREKIKLYFTDNDKNKILEDVENKNNLTILENEKGDKKKNDIQNKKEKKVIKENEEQEILTRSFLTDTKYYKRSKYSKAGFLKKKRNDKFTEKKENCTYNDFLIDAYNSSYTESKEDLLKNNIQKSIENENISLSSLLIRNYFSDDNRANDLELMNKMNMNDMKVADVSGTINTINEKKNEQSNNKICFMNEFTVIGEIVGVHGLLGYVKVVSFTTFNDIRFKNNCYRYLFMNNYPYPLPIKIIEVKESLKINFLYIKFEGIDTRTDALKLKSCLICDDKKTFPEIGENKYLSTDLLNFDIYIFNDFTNTSIGSVYSFISKYDYINSRSIQEISDDLIKIELNKNISLTEVFNIINIAKSNSNYKCENYSSIKNWKPINVLINKNNFNIYEDKENNLNKSEKGDKYYNDTLDNLEGCSYKKIYKCDYCDDVFDNIKEASTHENSHFNSDEELLYNTFETNNKKEKIYEVKQIDLEKVKNVEYFFIPIVKEKTIRSVNYENKKIYLDISTVFLMDDQK
ncbi:mitochondrial preribosomal assembly protein rimM precursor, putative [Plasmodium gallinaceum]|uniref:Mitochondrial preribosomal assembly protein rimM, putative n=1 Tax=Plasmodium gallinaceum TaxID=5849 RepID=A0A1J1GYE8_PLAGA|nr:mitochondrial preribosomal assembly protein rimM precursor, putative [Plasmodium gallinaceum]CRG97335.1 mitochondrial preribosomal assembly protein rimM precursor, putative [Plasmodium gallinaceum]